MSKVGYIYSPEYIERCKLIPVHPTRCVLVHSLIEAYDLLPRLQIIAPEDAAERDLRQFHSREFLKALKAANGSEDAIAPEFSLHDDCNPFPGCFDYVKSVAGGSLTAAQILCERGPIKHMIHWDGGRHHAKTSDAGGFCYVNDISIAILELLKTFERVMYIDIDAHHGDGVEECFAHSDKVMTLSFHHHALGYYPGTGALEEIGKGAAKYYTVNVPMHEGASDSSFIKFFEPIVQKSMERFTPDAVVMQCGADALIGDPLGQLNLTNKGYADAVRYVLSSTASSDVPILFLGGGGYKEANVARCWTTLTSIICGNQEELSNDIPDHEYHRTYAPDFELRIEAGKRPDKNSAEYIDSVVNTVLKNLDNVKPLEEKKKEEKVRKVPLAPSVARQKRPFASISDAKSHSSGAAAAASSSSSDQQSKKPSADAFDFD